MSWSNYHQHCYFCDGTHPPETYVPEAIERGVASFGFSSHAPVPLEVEWCIRQERYAGYLQRINGIKQEYAGRLPIFVGLEIDWLPGKMGPGSPQFDALDYGIGSVHLVQNPDLGDGSPYWEIDGPFKAYERGLAELFGNDHQKAVERYFEVTRLMLQNDPPDILGHMDKVKMNNQASPRYSEDEAWYRKAVLQTLEAAAHAGVVVEVNTRGVYKKKTTEPYPGRWVLEQMHGMGIPIMLNSDAHHPREITGLFPETAEMLLDIGFRELHVLTAAHTLEPRPFTKEGIVFV